MRCIGCDPGMGGAIALVCDDEGILEVIGMPKFKPQGRKTNTLDYEDLCEQLEGWKTRHDLRPTDTIAYIEKLTTQGGASDPIPHFSAIKMSHTAGLTHAAIAQVVSPVNEVMPRVWKKIFGLKKDKSVSVQTCRSLYGMQVPKKFSQDKAEAVLIARYGLNKYRTDHP